MYISIGGDQVVKAKDLLAVLDCQTVKNSSSVQEFLGKWPVKPIQIGTDTCKSIVVTANHIYFSPLSSSTLIKRSKRGPLYD
ncbi:extracellular matrix regulator RemB [Bacillus testis]|uniref:extracellular matrix regulator RemB n=1 Tax=Bacillus testis TaxID=1622072 RepID=UPI00084120B8|nr:extracellular matrix/biofilm biosynthesis regulator RemA family protein [Bacillus testis]